MRNQSIILFSSILILLSGCTKDRTCICTLKAGGTNVEITFLNSKKKDAIDACKDLRDTFTEKYSDCAIQ